MMFDIGDKVKINDGIAGVTLIDRGKSYTITGMHSDSGTGIFRGSDKHAPFLSFIEFPDLRFGHKYFHLVEATRVKLDEDLFIV